MQEVKKRRIVLASVLKPLNDPRMFEKMGQSLAPYYEVHIIGVEAAVHNHNSTIVFHPLPSFSRLSVNRIFTPYKILREFISIKPDLIIICTHELLWMVFIAKILLRSKVIYDIRENYFRNILHTNAFHRFFRIFIAAYVRLKEWIISPFIDTFFLAEAGYEKELSFVKKKKIILENKVKKISIPPSPKLSELDGNIHLLFSGTLAHTTGVFAAIELATKLYSLESKIRLLIIGYSPLQSVNRLIKEFIQNKPFIQFKSGEAPVPHPEILQAIMSADFGIISYPPNLSTQNTIPTKLFEYMGYALPILLVNYAPWVEMCRPYHAAISFDLSHFDDAKFLHAVKTTSFYSTVPSNVFWDVEEEKLLKTISTLLK